MKTLYPDDTEGFGPLKCRASFNQHQGANANPSGKFRRGVDTNRFDSIKVPVLIAFDPPD